MSFTCSDSSKQKMVLARVENTQNSKRVAIRILQGKPLSMIGFDLMNGLQMADMTNLPDGSRKIYFKFSGRYQNSNHIVEFFWMVDAQGRLASKLALPLDGIPSSIGCSRLPKSSKPNR